MYLYKELKIEEYFAVKERYFLIDVRSESEYTEDHILGACNIPLLNDEERKIIGTIYKERGVKAAKAEARRITLPGMLDKLENIYSLIGESKKIPLLYCARGGDRSGVMATFLAMENTNVYKLTGGYKAYRNHVLDYFKNSFDKKIKVFYGMTGSGKTEVLNGLKKKGLPVINLEHLANNRGSVFGHIGLGTQPGQKKFDSDLFNAIAEINHDFIMLEGESKKIGRLYIPESFYDKMICGDSYLIECSLDLRIDRIIREYGGYIKANKDEIIRSIEVLKPQLGLEKTRELILQYENGNLKELVRYLLTNYYDLLYERNRKSNSGYINKYSADNIDDCINKISEDIILEVD